MDRGESGVGLTRRRRARLAPGPAAFGVSAASGYISMVSWSMLSIIMVSIIMVSADMVSMG